MKKLLSFALALLMLLSSCAAGGLLMRRRVADKKHAMAYFNEDVRNSCEYALNMVLNDGAIPVLGSSELSYSSSVLTNSAHPSVMFRNGSSDFNMILIGRGYMQSLHHAMVLGAIADDIPCGKAVLILSPQWFTKEHLSSEIYSSRFSESIYADFIKNPKISCETKTAVTERVLELLSADESQKARVEKYRAVYLMHTLDPFTHIEMGTYDLFMNYKRLFLLNLELYKLPSDKAEGPLLNVGSVDWSEKMAAAESEGKASCTTNDLGIYDNYYNTYVKDSFDETKNSSVNESYLVSKEYDDLRLFLDVCRETGIEPMLVSVPVHGLWYDHIGWKKEDREAYYRKIRGICSEYGVRLADFSDKEYEPYFLQDIMHLGWKGWVYIDKAVYKFYKGTADE